MLFAVAGAGAQIVKVRHRDARQLCIARVAEGSRCMEVPNTAALSIL